MNNPDTTSSPPISNPDPTIGKFARWAIIENGIPREITFSTFEIDGVTYNGSTLSNRGEDAIYALGLKRIVDPEPKSDMFQIATVNSSESWTINDTTVEITYTYVDRVLEEVSSTLKMIINAKKEEVLNRGHMCATINDVIQIGKDDITNLMHLKAYVDLNLDMETFQLRSKTNVIYTLTRTQINECLRDAFAEAENITQQFWNYLDQAQNIQSVQEGRTLLSTVSAI